MVAFESQQLSKRQEANTNWINDATKKIDLKLNSLV